MTQIKDITAKYYNKAKELDNKSFAEIRENLNSPILVSEFDAAIKEPKAILINYFKYQKFRLFLRRWLSKIKQQYRRG
jgi:hypothetical protein